MKEFENSKDLNEQLQSFRNNLVLDIEKNGELKREIAKRLYDVYDDLSDIMKDNLEEIKEEIFKNPSEMKKHSFGLLQDIYDISNPEEQKWLLDKISSWSGEANTKS